MEKVIAVIALAMAGAFTWAGYQIIQTAGHADCVGLACIEEHNHD